MAQFEAGPISPALQATINATNAALGTRADAAAEGAVTNTDTAIAYLKQLVIATDRNVGAPTSGMAITKTLYVSATGTDADGLSWVTAFHTINQALDAASLAAGDCTLILISPSSVAYDINVTGDPTWAANVILQGTYRTWTRIVNTHVGATSILKLTGKAGAISLNFDLGATDNDGLIFTGPGFLVQGCFFTGTALTGAATALDLVGASQIINGHVGDCEFIGHPMNMTALKLTKIAYSVFMGLKIGNCLAGIQITDAESDFNYFSDILLMDNAIGLDVDAGNGQHFIDVLMNGNTVNIDDEVGDHMFVRISDQFPLTTYPDNLTGVSVPTHLNAATWGVDTELRSAATATKPFQVVNVYAVPSVSEIFRIRLSADSGATFFSDIIVDAVKKTSVLSGTGTEYVFNQGTRISASCQSLSGGDTLAVWLKIQEI